MAVTYTSFPANDSRKRYPPCFFDLQFCFSFGSFWDILRWMLVSLTSSVQERVIYRAAFAFILEFFLMNF